MFGEQLSLGGIAPAVPGLITTLGPGMAVISTYGWSGTTRFHFVTVGFFRSSAHRLGSRAVSQVHLTLFRFSPLRGVCSFSFLCFSGQVLRKKSMFECHVILERIFQQISKISKIVVDHRMPLQYLSTTIVSIGLDWAIGTKTETSTYSSDSKVKRQ